MEGETTWHSIEGAIKNLSSAIQSLPEEFKAKALKLLDTQLTNSSEQLSWSGGIAQGGMALKQESEEEKNESLLSLFASVTAASNSDPAAAEASTSSVLAEKRRRCRQQRVGTSETASDVVSSGIKKSLRSGPQRRTACRFDEKPAVKVTRQSTKEMKRNKKNSSSNVLAEDVKKSTRIDPKKTNNSNIIKTEEDDKKLMAEAEVPDAALLISSFDHQTEKQEMLTDSAADIMASVLKNRKRGRPRKLDICTAEIKTEESLKDLGISDVKEIIRHKKPGRPRQSSYSCGYVPKTKTFHCSECGKMLATKQSYREHQRQHTGEGFICDNCGQKFTTNSGFMLHKRYHSDDPHMYKCSKCKYIVSSQQLLDDHYQLRHDPNRPKSHICDVCGKAFHGSTQLEKHLFSHSNTKPYACDQCSFSTAYPGGLEKHKYNVHVADRKLFRCELCGIQLKSKGTYIEHIGRHFNQRKKKCEVCEKRFQTLHNWQLIDGATWNQQYLVKFVARNFVASTS